MTADRCAAVVLSLERERCGRNGPPRHPFPLSPAEPAMPTYEYRCRDCGREFEVFQRMSDHPGAPCPDCGHGAKRLISGGAGVLFKGDGFYITDYRSEDYRKKAREEAGVGAGKAGGGETGGDAGADSSAGASRSSSSSQESGQSAANAGRTAGRVTGKAARTGSSDGGTTAQGG